MIYLFLQVVFATSFTLIIKWVHIRKNEDVKTVGLLNYIVAAATALPFYLNISQDQYTSGAVLTGATMGLTYFVAFFFVIYCVKTVGASSTTVVSVLSLLFPIALAAIFWNETPNVLQSTGILIALSSLALVGFQKNRVPKEETAGPSVPDDSSRETPNQSHSPWFVSAVLLGFFILCGISRLAQETFKHVSSSEQRPMFLFSAFGVAAMLSIVALLVRHRSIGRTEFFLAALMGLANMLQTQLILKCLERYPGYVVFTTTSAGAIGLTSLVANLFLNERIERLKLVGICLAIASLFLLHLK